MNSDTKWKVKRATTANEKNKQQTSHAARLVDYEDHLSGDCLQSPEKFMIGDKTLYPLISVESPVELGMKHPLGITDSFLGHAA